MDTIIDTLYMASNDPITLTMLLSIGFFISLGSLLLIWIGYEMGMRKK